MYIVPYERVFRSHPFLFIIFVFIIQLYFFQYQNSLLKMYSKENKGTVYSIDVSDQYIYMCRLRNNCFQNVATHTEKWLMCFSYKLRMNFIWIFHLRRSKKVRAWYFHEIFTWFSCKIWCRKSSRLDQSCNANINQI